MNSGFAPQTTMSSTTIATRSRPPVSCLSRACPPALFVPTPSVEVARSGRRYPSRALASNSPAKPPIPPITSGPWVRATAAFISSTARSPASTSTPAAAYVTGSTPRELTRPRGRSRPGERVGRSAGQPDRYALGVRAPLSRHGLERQLGLFQARLAQVRGVRQRNRVDAGEAGRAQLRARLLGGLDHAVQRD